jgi:hypothetical protein
LRAPPVIPTSAFALVSRVQCLFLGTFTMVRRQGATAHIELSLLQILDSSRYLCEL